MKLSSVGKVGGATVFVAPEDLKDPRPRPVTWLLADDPSGARWRAQPRWRAVTKTVFAGRGKTLRPGAHFIVRHDVREDWFVVPVVCRAKRTPHAERVRAWVRALDFAALVGTRFLAVRVSALDSATHAALQAALADVLRSPHPFERLYLTIEELTAGMQVTSVLGDSLLALPRPPKQCGPNRRAELAVGAWVDRCSDAGIAKLTEGLERSLRRLVTAAATLEGVDPGVVDTPRALDTLIQLCGQSDELRGVVPDLMVIRRQRSEPPAANSAEGRAYWRVLHRVASSPLMTAPGKPTKQSVAGPAMAALAGLGVSTAAVGAFRGLATMMAKRGEAAEGRKRTATPRPTASAGLDQGPPTASDSGGFTGWGGVLTGAMVGAALTGAAAAAMAYAADEEDDDQGEGDARDTTPPSEDPATMPPGGDGKTASERLAELVLQHLSRERRSEVSSRLHGRGMRGSLKKMLVEELLERDPQEALLDYVPEAALRRRFAKQHGVPLSTVVDRVLRELGYSRGRAMLSLRARRAMLEELKAKAEAEPEHADLLVVRATNHMEAVTKLFVARLCRLGWDAAPARTLELLKMPLKSSLGRASMGDLERILGRLQTLLRERSGAPGSSYARVYGDRQVLPAGRLRFAERRNRCAHDSPHAPRTPGEKLALARGVITDAIAWIDYLTQGSPPLLPPIITVREVVKSDRGVELRAVTLDGEEERIHIAAERPVGSSWFMIADNNPIRVSPNLTPVDLG